MMKKMMFAAVMTMAMGVATAPVSAHEHEEMNPCNPCAMKGDMEHNPCHMKKDMKEHNPCDMKDHEKMKEHKEHH